MDKPNLDKPYIDNFLWRNFNKIFARYFLFTSSANFKIKLSQNESFDDYLLIIAALLLQADQICYAILCVFSYIAAGMEHRDKLRDKGRIYRTL